jgi:DNA-binding NtrC family response regulator
VSNGMVRKVKANVLVADDVHAYVIRDLVQTFCEKPVLAAADLSECWRIVQQYRDAPLIILLDLYWPYPNKESTYEFIASLRERDAGEGSGDDLIGSGRCAFILMSAYASPEERYEALKKRGRILKKPFPEPEDLHLDLLLIEEEMERRRQLRQNTERPEGLIGDCKELLLVYVDARLKAEKLEEEWKHRHIFIYGEQGTGKSELVKAIHKWSGVTGSLLRIDCGRIATATDGQMAHSFFFGHRRGAFAGATADQAGAFDLAQDDGMIHLDNIHFLTSTTQAPLSEFLETGEYTPVGGAAKKPKQVRARLVVTTSENPRECMLDGRLRKDIWRRLVEKEWFITIPPVRDRGEDIVLLARHFCSQWQFPKNAVSPQQMGLAPQAEDFLRTILGTFDWRGNISDVSGIVFPSLLDRFSG